MRTRADRSGPVSPPVVYILLALGDEERHGYGIMKDVERRTDGKVTLLPSSLYATLKRMVAEGLVTEVGEDDRGGRKRRVYRITEEGRAVALRELERMAALLEVARTKKLIPSDLPGSRTEGA